MSTAKAEKAEKKKTEAGEIPIEQIFGAIEQRVEGLAHRVRELSAENGRLKAAVEEGIAERDRARKEAEDLRSASASLGETAEKVSKLESEREQVRARIERLLSTLEEAEAGAAGA